MNLASRPFRTLATVTFLACFFSFANASPMDSATGMKTSVVRTAPVQRYDYRPDCIYAVRTAMGITTQIELGPSEKILDYSTGFSSGWELTRRDNVFYIKPKNVDVDTNMTIRTTTRTYIIELKVVATEWKSLDEARRAGVHYKVTFDDRADTTVAAEATKIPQPPELETKIVKDRDYHFDYDVASGRKTPNWLRPLSVHDDGRFTYIAMPDMEQFPTGNFPTIYMREKRRGGDSVVNTTVESNTIVVHGTYPYLVIRHGNNVVGLRRNAKK